MLCMKKVSNVSSSVHVLENCVHLDPLRFRFRNEILIGVPEGAFLELAENTVLEHQEIPNHTNHLFDIVRNVRIS